MNSPRPASLVFYRVLANQSGAPAGLLIDVGPGAPDSLPDLFQEATFSALSEEFPCYYDHRLAPDLVALLSAAGWRAIVPGTLQRLDTTFSRDALAPTTTLVDGDWCTLPPAKPTGAQAASRALALQLVQLVAADGHTHDIEALLRKDPTLSYQLLRLVNSLGVGGMGRRVTSFSQAILILGRQQLRRWLNLMLFAARDGDLRSGMLLARVSVRARLIEQLARVRGLDRNEQEQAFMTGMFSLLGILFGMPLPEVLAPLAIGESVHGALLTYEGELGVALRLCEAAEQCDYEGVSNLLGWLEVAPEEFNSANALATHWMLSALRGSRGSVDA
jgi:hypothetical protein